MKYLIRIYHPGWRVWKSPEIVLIPYQAKKLQDFHHAKNGSILRLRGGQIQAVEASDEVFDLDKEESETWLTKDRT